jgi:iron complex outermembrane receptor protein
LYVFYKKSRQKSDSQRSYHWFKLRSFAAVMQGNRFLIFAALFAIFLSAKAQMPTNPVTVSGIVLQTSPKESLPAPFSSVVFTSLIDTLKVEGTFSAEDGSYTLNKLTPGPWKRHVSAIGTEGYTDTVFIRPAPEQTLKTVTLTASAKVLSEFSLNEEKQDFRMEVDRKIFEVGNNLVVQGGSVLDAMRQVPLLSVDADGSITLRGSGNFLLYINDRPSGFTVDNRSQILDQIPASTIDRIELITSPSAKYEAEGVAGIINVVTKKERSPGTFGSIQGGLGWPQTANLGFNINRNAGKWNLSNSFSVRNTRRDFKFRHQRALFSDTLNPLNQHIFGNVIFHNYNASVNGAVDFTPNKKNYLQLTYLVSGNYSENNEVNYYRFTNPTDTLRRFFRNADNKSNGFNADVGFNYTRQDSVRVAEDTFRNGEWSLASSFSLNANDALGEYTQRDSFPMLNVLRSRMRQNNVNQVVSIQADRKQPIAERYTLEFGLRSQMRKLNGTQIADSLNLLNNLWFSDTLLTNDFIYTEFIQAMYVQFSGSITKSVDFQAGVRAEHTLALGTASSQSLFSKPYFNVFPTLQFKWTLSKVTHLTFAYNHRINRPSFWALNPFPDYSDPFSLRVGDPNIDPELSQNAEIGFTYVSPKGIFVYAGGYFRNVNNPFSRFISLDSSGVSTVRFTNFGLSQNLGIEGVFRGKAGKRLTWMFNYNFFRNNLDAGNIQSDLNAETFGMSLRGQTNFKFWKQSEIQLSLNFMSPMQMPQGYMYDFSSLDLGFRKELFKGRGSLTLNISDIFDTRRFRFLSEDFYFRGEVYRKPQSRVFTANFTWKFGNQGKEVIKRRRMGEGGMEMEMGGF